jgi:hypothetical protein
LATRVRSGSRVSPGNFSKGTIVVSGLEDVNRAFNRIDSRLGRAKTNALKVAVEPVRKDAEALAPHVVRNLRRGPGPSGADWSGVRTGVTQKTVYIAPTQRGRSRNPKKKRPNFKDLVLDRAWKPAADHNREKVIDIFSSNFFDDIAEAWRA